MPETVIILSVNELKINFKNKRMTKSINGENRTRVLKLCYILQGPYRHKIYNFGGKAYSIIKMLSWRCRQNIKGGRQSVPVGI